MSVAPDGSPVALYTALRGDREAAIIHDAIPPSSSVLELGCGAGRVTRHLVALGHRVTGVDNSEAMLAAIGDLAEFEPVLAEIGSLDLAPRRWPVVVMASHLINDADGMAFVASAARHLESRGALLVERHEPGWVDRARAESTERDGITVELTDVVHPRAGHVRATMVYGVHGTTYRQPFDAYEVDDDALREIAASLGLEHVRFLDENRTWVALRSGSS